jgi:hypothetical protein
MDYELDGTRRAVQYDERGDSIHNGQMRVQVEK